MNFPRGGQPMLPCLSECLPNIQMMIVAKLETFSINQAAILSSMQSDPCKKLQTIQQVASPHMESYFHHHFIWMHTYALKIQPK